MLSFEKQDTKGRAEMLALFDAGTFVETGAFMRRKGEDQPYDAVLTGYGSVNGKLAFAFVQDSDRKAGALDEVGADKIEKLYEQALRVGAPVIGVFDSAGAVVYDGATALSAYGRIMKCVSAASGIIPQISLAQGICTGMAAVIATMMDVTVTVKAVSEIAFHSGSAKGEDKTPYAENCGLTAINATDEASAVASVRDLIMLLPRNNRDVADVEPTDDPARPVSADELTGLALVKALADNGKVIDLYEAFAPEMTTALCAIGGRTCGVIATDASVEDGKLTPKGARKAARMVSFCDAFSIPVVTLVDSAGVDNSAPREPSSVFGKLAKAYATATTAKISAIVGNAYGAAFTLLGSRALGADLALALPESVISVLPPEVAVAFLMNDQITLDNPREVVEAQWMETVASPVAAAESGDIDDIVPATELRARLSSALYMLAEKADTTPDRKHGVPTL
ncbi:MAG: hypothetical protein IKM33_06575 [Clostridia bacterium]|nr:hypothetical protein [Clostridia bacterium]